jgi:ABC-2 type transport system permease protein
MNGRAPGRRIEPLLPNVQIVARREYSALVGSRLFLVSTIVLTALAAFVAVLPIAVKLVQRDNVVRIGIVANDADLPMSLLASVLPQSGSGETFELVPTVDEVAAITRVNDRELDAAIVAERRSTGQLAVRLHLGETIAQSQLQTLSTAVPFVALVDYVLDNPGGGFQLPDLAVLQASGAGSAAQPFDPSKYASRLILGAVFGFLIFITIVIYGMWVAQGVVAEKTSRVMELLISAASPRQLVVGKAIGIGLAGATQTLIVLVPALTLLALEDVLATLVVGRGIGISSSLTALSPGLLFGFAIYYVLGFTLYSLVYAAAGSLVSRPEDLQIIALPLSLIGIVGYFQGILALTGGITGFIRVASFVPFWSPFVMITRLAVGRVEPWELVLSVGLVVATIVVGGVIAIRIYAAGVLLYGQRPGLRAYVEAARRG